MLSLIGLASTCTISWTGLGLGLATEIGAGGPGAVRDICTIMILPWKDMLTLVSLTGNLRFHTYRRTTVFSGCLTGGICIFLPN
jgi:hypothetical protein